MIRSADTLLDTTGPTRPNRLEWSCLLLAAALLIVFRLHAFDLPLENDECNYAYVGARLLEGQSLYTDLWDHQPPGVFVLFAGVIALFGDAPGVFRSLTLVFSLASLGLIFLMLRRISGQTAAISGALLFAIVSSDPGTAGEGCNREIFMNTLILAAWYSVLRWRGGSLWWLVGSGLGLGLASVIKTIVAVHWVLLAIWIVTCVAKRTRTRSRIPAIVVALLLLGAGPAVLWLVTGGYFVLTDRWHAFYDAVFLFNLSYSEGGGGMLARFGQFFVPDRHPFIFDSALPLWLAGGAATLWLVVDGVITGFKSRCSESRPSGSGLTLILVASGYITVCLPARFWPHYYYLLIPALVVAVSSVMGRITSVLVAWWAPPTNPEPQVVGWAPPTNPEPNAPSQALACATTRCGRIHNWLMARKTKTGIVSTSMGMAAPWVARFVLLAMVPGAVLITEYRDYLSEPLFGLTVKRYNSRDFWGRAQGWNVARVTDPDDEVFVFGNDAEIYYYARRRCASRFTMITGLQSGFAGAEERRRNLIAELEESPPRLIVVLFDEPPFEAWKSFLDRHYDQPAGWDFHDKTGEPIMFVLARKDNPIEKIDWNWDRAEVGGWHLGDSH